jgi:hypothetical protein
MSESDERSSSYECDEDEEEGMAVRPYMYEPIDAHLCDAIYIT